MPKSLAEQIIENANTIGQRIKVAASVKGWALNQVAKRAELSDRQLYIIVNDDKPSNPRYSTIKRIAKVLDVSPQWLKTGEGYPHAAPASCEGIDVELLALIYSELEDIKNNVDARSMAKAIATLYKHCIETDDDTDLAKVIRTQAKLIKNYMAA